MMSSPCLEMMWNSPRNPIGALVTEELRRELWGAMHAEGKGANLGDTAVYLVLNIRENRQVVTVGNGEVKRLRQGTRLECPQCKEDHKMKGVRGSIFASSKENT